MSYPENNDPFAPWNDPIRGSDPFAPWNDPMKQNNPFACWNNPFGNGDFRDEVSMYLGKESYEMDYLKSDVRF